MRLERLHSLETVIEKTQGPVRSANKDMIVSGCDAAHIALLELVNFVYLERRCGGVCTSKLALSSFASLI